MNYSVLELTKQLIALPSITPNDAGCQTLIKTFLNDLNFNCQDIPYQKTSNLWATHGEDAPLIVLAGHTDVVDPGPLEAWHSDPFVATERDGYLYGRGAADMKGSLAAMLIACKQFIENNPKHKGSIGLMITSAEEGPSYDGTPKILEKLDRKIDYCIVGEPTSRKQLGDMIKIGRRGSLTGKLTIIGKQGHIAYPHLADNPIHKALLALHELTKIKWDEGNPHFQATSFQISNIHAGRGEGNVIPSHIDVLFNLRFSPEINAEQIKQIIEAHLTKHQLDYHIDWILFGDPYYTHPDTLTDVTTKTIHAITNIKPELSTSGGTSDARYIAKHCQQVIEFGPCNENIHQINECVKIADLEKLTQVYYNLLVTLI